MTATLRSGGSLATSACSARSSPPTNWPPSRKAVVFGLPISMRVRVAACTGAAMHASTMGEAIASAAARRLSREKAQPSTDVAAAYAVGRAAVMTRSSLGAAGWRRCWLHGSAADPSRPVDLGHGLGDQGRLETHLGQLEVRIEGQGLLELGNGPVDLAIGDVDLGAEGHRPGALGIDREGAGEVGESQVAIAHGLVSERAVLVREADRRVDRDRAFEVLQRSRRLALQQASETAEAEAARIVGGHAHEVLAVGHGGVQPA